MEIASHHTDGPLVDAESRGPSFSSRNIEVSWLAMLLHMSTEFALAFITPNPVGLLLGLDEASVGRRHVAGESAPSSRSSDICLAMQSRVCDSCCCCKWLGAVEGHKLLP